MYLWWNNRWNSLFQDCSDNFFAIWAIRSQWKQLNFGHAPFYDRRIYRWRKQKRKATQCQFFINLNEDRLTARKYLKKAFPGKNVSEESIFEEKRKNIYLNKHCHFGRGCHSSYFFLEFTILGTKEKRNCFSSNWNNKLKSKKSLIS